HDAAAEQVSLIPRPLPPRGRGDCGSQLCCSQIEGCSVFPSMRFAPPARAAFAWGGPAQKLRCFSLAVNSARDQTTAFAAAIQGRNPAQLCLAAAGAVAPSVGLAAGTLSAS